MRRIIISRTDAIGDVVLTLPLAGIIKKYIPDAHIIFFGRTYTQPVVELSENINEFINYDEFSKLNKKEQVNYIQRTNADTIIHVFPRKDIAISAKRAKIKTRIGTSHRLYHLLTCNKLMHFSRKNSDLHETQLNIKLLKGLGIKTDFSLQEIVGYFGINKMPVVTNQLKSLIDPSKLNIVIHPRSHGSAREWGLANFKSLIYMLKDHPVNIFITGSATEKTELQEWMTTLPPQIIDLTGKLSLQELIGLLSIVDGIFAGSTGPLHIASALGRHALGIYPPIRPMHPGRWAPIGKQAEMITHPVYCDNCRDNPTLCNCLRDISPASVAKLILRWKK